MKQRQPQRSKRKNMARRVPITIPAIAPPLKPLLVVVDCMPAAVAPEVPVGDGVSNATVVVADPVEVTVWVVALVGRMNAVPVAVAEKR